MRKSAPAWPRYAHVIGAQFPLSGRSIVILSSIDWDFLWQGHQEISARLAAAGNRVIYVENTGVRSVRLGDARRLLHIGAKLLRQVRASPSTLQRVQLVTPLLVPFPKSDLAGMLNRRIFLPRLARRLRQLAGPDPILFTFLPTPNALRLVESLRGQRSVVVYWCIADFHELSDLGTGLVSSEERLVRMADLVFVQGRWFGDRFKALNPHIHQFQFGVDVNAFSSDRAPAAEIARLARPVIGYCGGLHRHVDLELLVHVAETFASGTLAIVGPAQREAAALRRLPNVRLLGQRPFQELPGLLAGFDVAVIPYVRSTYTDTVFPTKLFEYLAAGRPVVSTDLPEVRKLGLPDRAVRIASSSDSFIAAMRQALAERDPSLPRWRADLAHVRDWSVIASEMARLISDVPGAGSAS